MVMKKAEHQIVAEILVGIGCNFPTIRAWRQNTGAFKSESGSFVRFGVVGQGDISGIIGPHGRRLEIEVKVLGGKQSKHQKSFQEMIQKMGGLYILAYDFERDVFPRLKVAV